MIYLLKNRGIKVILLDLPMPDIGRHGFKKTFHDLLSWFNNSLENIAEKEKIPLVKSRQLITITDFYDQVHLQLSGGKKIVQILIPLLEQFNILKSESEE